MHKDGRCLTDLELGAYVERGLPPSQRARAEECLAGCDACRQEHSLISRLLQEGEGAGAGDAPRHVVERVVGMYPLKKGPLDVVLAFLHDAVRVVFSRDELTISSPVPAFGLRTARQVTPRMVVLMRSFDLIDVQLDIEKVSEGEFTIRTAVVERRFTGEKGMRAELVSQGRELASYVLGDREVIFEDVREGVYAVRVSRDRTVLGEIAMKIT